MDLAQVTDELYGLPPEDFRAARDEQAAAARAAGDKALAKQIAALRRPVVSAWLVNRLAREVPDQVGELIMLGESLRDAQQILDGDRLRELSVARRALVTALAGEAKRIAARAGRAVSLQVEREVEATVQAALADPDAAAAVSAGQLPGPLAYAGLGVGEAAGPARPLPRQPSRGQAGTTPAAARTARARPAAGADVVPIGDARATGAGKASGKAAASRAEREAAQREAREAAAAERRAQEATAAERDLADAAGALAGARTALGEAEQAVADAKAAQEEIRQRAERLDRELAEALAEQSRVTRTVRDAQRGRETAARAVDAATKRLARAETAVTRTRTALSAPS